MFALRSLRTKITTAFAILGLGPLIIMGVIAILVITSTHRQDIATIETQVLRQKLTEIDKFINDAVGLFEIRVGFEEAAPISLNDQKFLLEKLLDSNPFILQATFVDLQGQENSKLNRAPAAGSPSLNVISSAPEFQTAKSGQHYFGPVQYGNDGPVMTIAAPVSNRNNQIIMVLTGTISLSPLSTTLAQTRLGQNGYIYVIDRDGIVVASADKSHIKKNLGSSPWIQEVREGARHTSLDKGDIRTGLDGQEVIAAALPFQKLGWGFIAEWPRQDAFSVVSRIQRNVILFSLAMILVIALLGWLAERKILKPLAILREGAQKIGQGIFNQTILIRTGDELQELGEILTKAGKDLAKVEELKSVEIHNQALAESLKKEKELSQSKDRFISNTSHQIRTPLSILNWNLELLADATTDEERKKVTSDFKSALEQLNTISNDLLTLSEFGPGFENTVSQEVPLLPLIQQVVSSRDGAIKEKQITITAPPATNLAPLKANSRALQIVLEHLLDNAITYTAPKGTVMITCIPDKETVTITIQDSGIGIPERDKTLIFTPFFRATNAIQMKNVGTGLGLYISKNILEGHGGKLWFESEEGKGTTIHCLIPVGHPAQNETPAAPAAATTTPPTVPTVSPLETVASKGVSP